MGEDSRDESAEVVVGPEPLPKLVLPDRCLAVFVDDTGHEEFKGQPFYGLGGCAALGRDIERLIYRPWKELRMKVKGSTEAPLHANKFPSIAKTGDVEAVASFFRAHQFFRFAVVLTTETTTELPENIGRIRAMKGVLEARINDIVRMTLCKEVKVIFESSDRVNASIQEAFQDLTLVRGSKPIPSECYFMPKSGREPALEVADFIMHAVGRQAKHNLARRGSFEPDFCAVFHAVDSKLTSFREVGAITLNR